MCMCVCMSVRVRGDMPDWESGSVEAHLCFLYMQKINIYTSNIITVTAPYTHTRLHLLFAAVQTHPSLSVQAPSSCTCPSLWPLYVYNSSPTNTIFPRSDPFLLCLSALTRPPKVSNSASTYIPKLPRNTHDEQKSVLAYSIYTSRALLPYWSKLVYFNFDGNHLPVFVCFFLILIWCQPRQRR